MLNPGNLAFKVLHMAGVCLVLFIPGLAQQAARPDQVRIDAGMIAGASAVPAGVRVFKGVPYAAPPVGDLRSKPPQPAAKWKGVREAD